MASRSNAFDAFRHRTFRRFWAASVVSNTGGMVHLVGAGWLMATLTSSQSMVALVQASVAAPVVFVSYIAGVMADSRDRRSLMLFSQLFMLLVSIVLTALVLTGMLTPRVLLTCTFLIGLGMALNNPPWQASINDMVPRQDLPSAVSMNAMGMNVTRSVGPALGGVIVAALGATAAFAVNAVTYLALIGVLLGWRPSQNPSRLPREGFLRAMGAGVRYLMLSPNILTMDARAFLFCFAGIVVQSLLPLVARDILQANASVYGTLLGAFGGGAVLGALSSVRLRNRFAHETIARSCMAGFALMCLSISQSTSLMLTLASVLAAGFCWINVMTMVNASVQMSTPRWVLGRLISLFMTAIFAGQAIGSWVWGGVAESYGLPAAFLIAGGVMVVNLALGFRFPLPAHSDLDLQPLNRVNEPALKLNLQRRSGPIQVTVEYRIDQGDVAEFLTLIDQRRRIRVRDGARRWMLLRDVAEPDIWIESYHFPTWTDYVRSIDRRTVTDDIVIQRLLALHRAAAPPKVQRMIERQTVQPLDDTPRLDLPQGDAQP